MPKKKDTVSKKPDTGSEIIIYRTEGGQTKLEARLQDESVWLTQQHMADLFQTTQQNISLHISNIYDEGELTESSTHKKYLSVQPEGAREVRRERDFYNLDMIISVGYRVKSHIATRFRQWATLHLKEFVIKGFVLDDDRLKNPDHPLDYYDELLQRIQDIRTSERRFYQKITDIYATSIDYDPTLDVSIEFFKTVQNKMHWAITGRTAAEIIHERADSTRQNMGLTNWRGEKPRKQDVVIAKNYLTEEELRPLNNLVEQYLIYAQGQAMRRIPMTMQDWINKLNEFLKFNEREILTHAGKISHEMAKELAEAEYDKFHAKRIAALRSRESDFDKAIKQIEEKKPKGIQHGKE